jgi:error-prone DNA polymerase
MGWDNPVIPWSELEKTLSWGRHGEAEQIRPRQARPHPDPSRHGPPPPADRPGVPATPWAELHCHSSFSFLDGASSPQELVDEAVRLGVHTLAITDHDGFYGASQFAQAAKAANAEGSEPGPELATAFGAELSLGLDAPQSGIPDPSGEHLLVLARGAEGYRRLSRTIGAAHLAGGQKGRPVYDLESLAEAAGGHWAVLTGCRKGAVRQALDRYGLTEAGLDAAGAQLDRLTGLFGAGNVLVELTDHSLPGDDVRNDALAEAAGRAGLPLIASNNVHYARPAGFRLASVLAAIRARRSLAELEGWLPAAPTAHLRSGAEMTARLAHFPGVVERTARLGAECAFDFTLVKPHLPDFDVPEGHTEASWLRKLTVDGAGRRYGPPELDPRAYAQLELELATIEREGFPGYFLIVHDITEFCRKEGILCQGRGSAANSAVCYALGITNVDAVKHNLVFERFLSPERDGPPDIDIDIEAKRREEAIQYVYRKYGRDRAAQVANVITYRGRLAVRDAARALGYGAGAQDAWARGIGPHEPLPKPSTSPPSSSSSSPSPSSPDEQPPAAVLEIAALLHSSPRHLGIHSGGMIIVDRPVAEVCPTEWARMENRSVVQWDKDDCAEAGLVKFDMLGLGMLGALHDAFDLVRAHHGVHLSLGDIPDDDPDVYAMLGEADSVGVFQVESRAQMATLPRLRPKNFYDLVIEVSLIRPGPIQGGAVHPYLRRRAGLEDPDPPHELLRPVLERTLGVVLYQEQCLQMAVAAANFTPGEADQLRRAMSAKRSTERMRRLRTRLMEGMAANEIPSEVAEDVYAKLEAFSNYGFPEAHSISMAHLVCCSSYLKRHYPAAFTAALLNNQPMGFYSSASLISDARRHGVTVRGVDVNASAAKAILDPLGPDETYDARTHQFASAVPQPAIRLGLATVRSLGTDAAERIVAERDGDPAGARDGASPKAGLSYTDLEDFVQRTRLPRPALEALATAGAFGCFGLSRRAALWQAGALAGTTAAQLPGSSGTGHIPPLSAMTAIEQTFADLWSTGSSPDSHPIGHLREQLAAVGVVPAAQLGELRDRGLVRVAGLVTHRQRPPTAGGVCFLSLEDETGMVNVICPTKSWERQRRAALQSGALIVHGTLEKSDGAINVVAGRLEPLRVAAVNRSRDFR